MPYSPDGNKIAFGGGTIAPDGGLLCGGPLLIMDADGRNETTIHLRTYDFAWSPDGKKIAYAIESGLFLVNPDGTGNTELAGIMSTHWVSWSPDRKWIAFAAEGLNRDNVYNYKGRWDWFD